MGRLTKLILLILLSVPCAAQYTLVQQNNCQQPFWSDPSNVSCTFSNPVQSGHLINIIIGQGCNRLSSGNFCGSLASGRIVAGTPQSITDTLGNTYGAASGLPCVGNIDSSGEAGIYDCFTCNSQSGSDTINISATHPGGSSPTGIKDAVVIQEWSGTNSSSSTLCEDNQFLWGIVPNTGQPGQGSATDNPLNSLNTVAMPIGGQFGFRTNSNILMIGIAYDRFQKHNWTATSVGSTSLTPNVDNQVQTSGCNFAGQSLLTVSNTIITTSNNPGQYQWNFSGICNFCPATGNTVCETFVQGFILTFDFPGTGTLSGAKKVWLF